MSKIKEIGNQSASHWLEQMSIDSISQESVNISFPNNFISSLVQQNISSVVFDLLADIVERKDFSVNYNTREMNDAVQEIVEDASTLQVSKVIKKQRFKKNGLNNKDYDKKIINGTTLTSQEVLDIQDKLNSLSKEELIKKVGTGREDFINTGMSIYRLFFKTLNKDVSIVFDDGLREGVALKACSCC